MNVTVLVAYLLVGTGLFLTKFVMRFRDLVREGYTFESIFKYKTTVKEEEEGWNFEDFIIAHAFLIPFWPFYLMGISVHKGLECMYNYFKVEKEGEQYSYENLMKEHEEMRRELELLRGEKINKEFRGL